MADKSFGVKELNLLNASGTPTVTSPNNLNLNANTVAISTSCTIGNNLTVTSTTNSANLNATGIGTLTRAFATDLFVSGISTITRMVVADNVTGIGTITRAFVTDMSVSGVTTITVPANANPHSSWDVVNNSSSAYRFTGPGQDGAEDNPNIYLVRGQRYVFKMNASGHPFQIRVSNGGSAYSDGVTNNGAQTGNVVFNVQHDAPAQLFYQCTSHGGMVGNIYIVGQHLANGADNRVLTATSAYGMNGEATLTFTNSGSAAQLNLKRSTSSNQEAIFYYGSSNLEIETREATGIKLKTNTSDRLIIDSNGNVTIDSSSNSMEPGAPLSIISDKNVETGVDDMANYHLVLKNPNNDTGEAIGLAFGITDTVAKVGAAILHERDSAGSQGSMKFLTRPDNAGPPVERLRIKADGDVDVKTGNLIIGTSGKGIEFHNYGSGTNISSNLLDDYEEGSAVPDFANADNSIVTVNRYTYTKVGRLVHFEAKFTVGSNNDGSGFGFTLPVAQGGSRETVIPAISTRSGTHTNPFAFVVNANQSYAYAKALDGFGTGDVEYTDFAGDIILVSGTYEST